MKYRPSLLGTSCAAALLLVLTVACGSQPPGPAISERETEGTGIMHAITGSNAGAWGRRGCRGSDGWNSSQGWMGGSVHFAGPPWRGEKQIIDLDTKEEDWVPRLKQAGFWGERPIILPAELGDAGQWYKAWRNKDDFIFAMPSVGTSVWMFTPCARE